jgi:hypothetical protein
MECLVKTAKTLGNLTNASTHSRWSLGQLYGRISRCSKAAPINLPVMRGVRVYVKSEGLKLYWNTHKRSILTVAFLCLLPSSFIGYEYEAIRGFLFFIGVNSLFLLSTLIPFRKSLRSKYGKSQS